MDKAHEELAGRRVLVIDDDAQIRRLLAKSLGRAGLIVVLAENGDEATDVMRRERADLIITDIVMPDKNGIEIILEMKHAYPDTRILAISGGGNSGSEDQLQYARRLGADEILMKPLDLGELLNKVRRILEDKKPFDRR